MSIVLASGSPRRKELLETLGLDFAVVPAKGEEIAPCGAGPAETVEALSRAKAEEVAKDFPNALIIAADTVVWAARQDTRQAQRRDRRKSHAAPAVG